MLSRHCRFYDGKPERCTSVRRSDLLATRRPAMQALERLHLTKAAVPGSSSAQESPLHPPRHDQSASPTSRSQRTQPGPPRGTGAVPTRRRRRRSPTTFCKHRETWTANGSSSSTTSTRTNPNPWSGLGGGSRATSMRIWARRDFRGIRALVRHPRRFPGRSQPPHSFRVYAQTRLVAQNQSKLWFSILACRLLKRASFSSVEQLRRTRLQRSEVLNRTMAKPFKWTYDGQSPGGLTTIK